MKEWVRNNWPTLVALILALVILVLFLNRKDILNHRVTKAKIEIFDGIKDQDKEKIKNGIDSIKFK